MSIRIEPWGEDDRWLLERLLGDPAMMEHLGGAEPAEKITSRQARYERPDSHQFKVVVEETAEPVGHAARLLERAAADSSRRYLHAFPSVDNAASNAICRKTGFVLLEALDFAYPPGHMMRCNDWRADLAARRGR